LQYEDEVKPLKVWGSSRSFIEPWICWTTNLFHAWARSFVEAENQKSKVWDESVVSYFHLIMILLGCQLVQMHSYAVLRTNNAKAPNALLSLNQEFVGLPTYWNVQLNRLLFSAPILKDKRLISVWRWKSQIFLNLSSNFWCVELSTCSNVLELIGLKDKRIYSVWRWSKAFEDRQFLFFFHRIITLLCCQLVETFSRIIYCP